MDAPKQGGAGGAREAKEEAVERACLQCTCKGGHRRLAQQGARWFPTWTPVAVFGSPDGSTPHGPLSSSNERASTLQRQHKPQMTCLNNLSPTTMRSCRGAGMHRHCAMEWFGEVRKTPTLRIVFVHVIAKASCAMTCTLPCRSTVCEVCGSEAHGLPAELRQKLRWLVAVSPNIPGQQPTSAMRLLGFPTVRSFLAHYCWLCVLPALLASISLSFFFVRKSTPAST
eukprot:365028-Chlamydomonas_euryale.AAC.37